MIAIVCGSGTDWLKNVLASGTAAIVHHGATYPVDQPEIVPMERARAYVPATLQRAHRLVHIEGCLRVRRVKAIKPSVLQAVRVVFVAPAAARSQLRPGTGATLASRRHRS